MIELPAKTDTDRSLQEFGSALSATAEALRGVSQLFESFQELRDLGSDAAGPPKISIVGGFNAGKSTLLNALLGRPVLKADVLPANAAVVVLEYSETPSLRACSIDGTTMAFEAERFYELAFEGDESSSARLRSDLTHFTLGVPHTLLKTVNFVDTPGLGALHSAHGRVTQAFLHRTDAMVWITPVTEAGTATELHAIRNIGKPIDLLVVNRMDAFDTEEENESREEAVTRIARSFGHPPEAAIGVSARLAYKGKHESLQYLIEESNWSNFEAILKGVVLSKAEGVKRQSVEQRASVAFEALAEKLYQTVLEITTQRSEIDTPIQRVSNERIRTKATLERWNNASSTKQLATLSTKFVSLLVQARIQGLKQSVEECRQATTKLRTLEKELEERAEEFRDRQESINSRRRAQGQKGFLESTFDFFFGNANQELDSAQQALDRDRDYAARRRREMESDQSNLESQMAGFEVEAAAILDIGREELQVSVNMYRLQLLALRRKKRVWKWTMFYRESFFNALDKLLSSQIRSLDSSAANAFGSSDLGGRIFDALDRCYEQCEAGAAIRTTDSMARLAQAYRNILRDSIESHGQQNLTAGQIVELLRLSNSNAPLYALVEVFDALSHTCDLPAVSFARALSRLQLRGDDATSSSLLGAVMGSWESTIEEFDQVFEALPRISQEAKNSLLHMSVCGNASLHRYVLRCASRRSLAYHKALTTLCSSLVGQLKVSHTTAGEC